MKFSHEYKKLNYPIFTTIRADKSYYKAGQIINIETPQQKFRAEILAISEICLQDITENMAYRDADCTALELKRLMQKFYKDKADELILLTLAKIK